MAREVRKPHRGEGVPKETREQNSLGALESLLRDRAAGNWSGLANSVSEAGYFEASMQEQFDVMVNVCLSRATSPESLIESLASSNVERLRGAAPVAVLVSFGSDLDRLLPWLLKTAQLDGTWPREMSCGVLHRQFVEHGVSVVLPRVRRWTELPHEGARRVVTEAIRPRLMMAPHISELKSDPSPLKGLLAPLIGDPSKYVRNSVANCLNDVSKDNPDTVVSWIRGWWKPDLNADAVWVLNRGLRTLVSDAHPEAMLVAGYADPASLSVRIDSSVGEYIVINEVVRFHVTVGNPGDRPARVFVQLRILEPSKSGRSRTSVYKVGSGLVAGKTERTFTKSVHFVDKTRQQKLPGLYRATFEINGRRADHLEFNLERKKPR